MFSTIFKQELKYWFHKPLLYIYASIFLLLAFFLAASSAGLFDSINGTTGSSRIVNSPLQVTGTFNILTIFIFFLFPSIIGVSIYRDFKSEMHTILFSYPFTKTNYLFAKFLSGILVVTSIVLMIAIGLIIGFRFPGTNQDLVGNFNFVTYLQSYVVFILPNVLFFGAVVFAVVTFSRSIGAGFITVIILLFFQGAIGGILSEPEQANLLAILDPFGFSALSKYTKYWTMSEQNELQIPIKEYIIYNRLFWLAISSLIFGLVYKYFKFSQNALSISFKKTKGERVTKTNFSGITTIKLTKVSYDFSFLQNLKTTWRLSILEFKYIFKSLPFICILLVGILILLIALFGIGEIFGTKTLPVTWQMLTGGAAFSLIINLCTFLYAGMLIQRARTAKMNHLVDSTPIPNWTLLLSKFIALIKMQLVLLAVIMVAGILFQTYKGFYDYEIMHYVKELFGLKFLNYLVWAFLAIFIQTLFKNQYLGFFVLLILTIIIPLSSLIGIELAVFKYNEGPGFSYSDMNGYGSALSRYLWYKLYWILGGCVLLMLSLLFWVRGIPNNFAERISLFGKRFKLPQQLALGTLFIAFLSLGITIYKATKSDSKNSSSKQAELDAVKWEKTYKKFEKYKQPRIVGVVANMDIFPKERTYKASAVFTMVNKTNQAIDSIFLNHNSLKSTFEFNKPNNLVLEDTVFHFDIYQLEQKLQPGDSIQLAITLKSKENTTYQRKSPIRANGTFIRNPIFPSLGYSSAGELRDDKTREKYDLPKNNLRPHPTDSSALGNTYISKDSDWIDFEATVSTSEDQIAIAPGYLQKEWVKDGRKYFHYKMDSKILNFYAFNSARYEVKKELWNGISLEIYYHKPHTYNLDRMMKGMKASLTYNAANFSPYQFKQARIIEFPRTGGTFAQAFANTMPFSEGIGFIADVDDEDENGVDYPFAVTAHEVAHQWWAHQVIGADVLGATLLSESMSEYVSLKVLEKNQGKQKMRTFLKKALDGYLMQRTFETKREKPLMYNDGQGYIHYQKGSMILYAMSDYLGEEKMNNAIKKYIEKVKFQEPPYTTSIEFVNHIKEVTPDSLQYLIKDMFETITLYKNRIVAVESTALENGKYKVDIEFEVAKYRNDEKGKKFYGEQVGDTLSYKTAEMKKPILSVPLADYIDLGIFTEEEVDGKKKEKQLYLKKHKITTIFNKVSIIVDEKPTEVGIDPYNKLIDTKSEDNRRTF